MDNNLPQAPLPALAPTTGAVVKHPDQPSFSPQEWSSINEPVTSLSLPTARTSGSSWAWWVFALVLIGLVAGPMAWWFWPSAAENTTDLTGTVSRGDLQIIVTEKGQLESAKTVDVRCEVEGRQIKIIDIVPEGTAVKKGDVVVKFDTEELTKAYQDQEVKWKTADGKSNACREELKVQENKKESEIEKAKLALTLAELDLEKYFHPKGEFQKLLDTSKSAVAKAERELEIAKEELKNYQVVVNRGFETPETLRRAETKVLETELMLTSARKDEFILENFTKRRQRAELEAKANDAKSELQRTKSSTQAAVLKAKSELDAAVDTTVIEKRALDRIKKQLDKCEVKAPQDGILVYSNDREWDEQARIRPGALIYYQMTIFRLPDLSKMQIKARVHESQIKKVKKDQSAEIVIEALPNKVLKGKVLSIGTLADNQNFWERGVKAYSIEVSIDNLPLEAGLKPGMTAEVRVFSEHYKDVLMVPVQAVCERNGEHFTYVKSGNQFKKRSIKVGENNEKFVIVTEGLEEGERVALNARRRLAAEIKASDQNEKSLSPVKATQPAPPTSPPVKEVVTKQP